MCQTVWLWFKFWPQCNKINVHCGLKFTRMKKKQQRLYTHVLVARQSCRLALFWSSVTSRQTWMEYESERERTPERGWVVTGHSGCARLPLLTCLFRRAGLHLSWSVGFILTYGLILTWNIGLGCCARPDCGQWEVEGAHCGGGGGVWEGYKDCISVASLHQPIKKISVSL